MSNGSNYYDVIIEAMRLADQIASKCNPEEKTYQEKHVASMSVIFHQLMKEAVESMAYPKKLNR